MNDRELIKEVNGWKLYKGDEPKEYTIVTTEGYEESLYEVDEESFNKIVERGYIHMYVLYWYGWIVDGEIEIQKGRERVRSNEVDNFYKENAKERDEVIERVNGIIQRANEYAEKIKKELKTVETNLNFEINCETDDYDCGGHPTIIFEIDGIQCIYNIYEEE